jgi:DNA-binding Xre family transcriptional regulator
MSKLYENIAQLCADRGISGYRLCKDVGIQPSILTDLKMGRKTGMSVATASKIAAYLEVSVDRILEGMPKPTDELDEFTYAMYQETKELSEENRKTLLEMARFFRLKQEQEAKSAE